MPAIRLSALSLTIALLLPGSGLAAQWNCVAAPSGGWACYDLEGEEAGAPASGNTDPPPPPATGEPPAAVTPPPAPPASETPQAPAEKKKLIPEPAAAKVEPPLTPATPAEAETPPEPARKRPAASQEPGPEETEEAPAAPSSEAPTPATTAVDEPAAQEEAVASETPTEAEPRQDQTTMAGAPADDQPEPAATTALPAAREIDRGLAWGQCYPWPTPAPLSFSTPPDDLTVIDADGALLEPGQNRILFEGDVQVRRGQRMVEADRIIYDQGNGILTASGQVYLEQPRLRLTAERARLDLEREQGEMERVGYRLTDRGARGEAARARLDDPQRSHLEQVTYSTCAPGNDAWQLEADTLDLDRETGVGVARNARLRLKGVPFLYLPYATFPIDDRRKSGFLAPSVGDSDRSGYDLATPYYFNIAPNMDATLTPRYLSKRGLMLGGEFRYLQPRHHGRLRAEILPSDSAVADGDNRTRGAFSYQAGGSPAPRWGFDVNLNYASDKYYLDDLGNSLAVTSARQLERRADLTYKGDGWTALARTQYFQTVDPDIASIDRPYIRLPQLLFDLNRPDQARGLTYLLRAEYVNFDHSDDTKVKGHRIDLAPSLALPLYRPWGFFTPKATLRYTKYQLDNQQAGWDSSPDRALGTLSLDGGLFFERSANWFDTALLQTLEPRLFYLYTPYQDQSELPDFDTARVEFSFASLFRENRFSGADRVGDANQVTAALTSRTLSRESGQELFRASIGQIYYFRDRLVQLPGVAIRDDGSSSVVGELAARLGANWSSRASFQWNPHKSSRATEKAALSLHYQDGRDRLVNLSYRMTDQVLEQTDLSGRWPLGPRVTLVGRWTYSLRNEVTNLAFAGIEYDSCCWRLRLVAQQLLTSIDAEPSNSILLQFELKGLASLGQRVDDYLEQNITGYHAN